MILQDWKDLRACDARPVLAHKQRELQTIRKAQQDLRTGCPSSDALAILKAEVEILEREINQLNQIIINETSNHHSARA